MAAILRPACLMLLVLTFLTGAVYPVVVTGLAQVLFPFQANGSIRERDGKSIGSEWIGQTFDDPRYFWSRPSATSPPYNGAASSGSNLGPTNPALLEGVTARVHSLRAAHPDANGPIPVDLVTASGSGLDPHISPAAAQYQAERVAKARGLDRQTVKSLIEGRTEPRSLGLLGEARVNVLLLNLELDSLSQPHGASEHQKTAQ